MLFKSQVFTQASGSIGGMTFSRNRGGLYTRSRAIPTDPATAPQLAVRAAMGTLNDEWRSTLTQAQRDAWKTYADNVGVPNALSDVITLSGQQMFIRCNMPRVNAGISVVPDGPTNFSKGSFNPVDVVVTDGTSAIDVNFDDTDAWANESGAFMLVQSGRPVAETINFFRGPFRLTDTTIDGDDTTPPTSPATVNALNGPYALGQTLFARVQVTRADGRLSDASIVSIAVDP